MIRRMWTRASVLNCNPFGCINEKIMEFDTEVLVMTPEKARELFDAGTKRGMAKRFPDFDQWLEENLKEQP